MSISLLRRASETAASWLWPLRCCSCDAFGEAPFCFACAETLVASPAGCPVCGAPADEALQPALKPRRCGHCRERAPPYALARAPYLHGGALAEAVHRLKYDRRDDLARPLGVLFEACLRPRADVVVAVPLHPARLRHRGFDQAQLLASAAGERFGIRVESLLVRVRETRQQVGLDRPGRERNVDGAFAARGRVTGRRICLIDDVLTTGATAGAATRALLRAGAARVEVRTLARAP